MDAGNLAGRSVVRIARTAAGLAANGRAMIGSHMIAARVRVDRMAAVRAGRKVMTAPALMGIVARSRGTVRCIGASLVRRVVRRVVQCTGRCTRVSAMAAPGAARRCTTKSLVGVARIALKVAPRVALKSAARGWMIGASSGPGRKARRAGRAAKAATIACRHRDAESLVHVARVAKAPRGWKGAVCGRSRWSVTRR
jgi:hypothetical protein